MVHKHKRVYPVVDFDIEPKTQARPMSKFTTGFTLIELLVVIAIIGILSSVVVASLNGARKKARDARRVDDVKQLQLALDLYFDSSSGGNGKYPAVLSDLALKGFIPAIPVPPPGTDANYLYAPLNGTACSSYHLGITLEEDNANILNSRANKAPYTTLGSSCPGGTTPTADPVNGQAAKVYDVIP